MTIDALKNKIWQTMLKNTKEGEVHFATLGYFLIIAYLVFYFFNRLVSNPQGYENLTLRLIVSFCGLLLILYRYWPKKLELLTPVFYYFTLLLSFPYFFTFMLLNNQSSSIWHLNGLAGFVLLSLFVDWASFIILSVLGILLAIIAADKIVLSSSLISIFSSYTIPIIYFFIFSKKRKMIELEKDWYNQKITKLNNDLEKKVHDRTAELKQALAYKTEFFNNISHEIRTPVHGFTAISEGLVDFWDELDEKKKYKYIQHIAENAKRLENLINSILDMSKFIADKMQVNLKEIDLNELVENIIEECNILYLTNKNIKINYIPKPDCIALADEEEMGKVLRNLFFNAIKFTPNNGTIDASLVKDYEHLHFSISDTGIGIPNGELLTIFEPFVQSSRTKAIGGGTGLGLGIVKKIIELHNGKVWAENNSKAGAKFTFTIPIYKSQVSEDLNKNISINTANILIIDDDQACLTGAEILLSGTNYSLVTKLGGVAGLSYLKTYSPIDVILLDLMMPDLDGLAILKEIKKDSKLKNIPVIIQSGASDQNLIDNALKLGISSFIKKPYDRETLLESIRKSLIENLH
ncbi:MAG: ATP-binding protein [Pseudomonadota bacterium]